MYLFISASCLLLLFCWRLRLIVALPHFRGCKNCNRGNFQECVVNGECGSVWWISWPVLPWTMHNLTLCCKCQREHDTHPSSKWLKISSESPFYWQLLCFHFLSLSLSVLTACLGLPVMFVRVVLTWWTIKQMKN